jgi:SAM-dependent methyltransferase
LLACGVPTLEEIRAFWEAHPVAASGIGPRATRYDFFRAFDNLREGEDVEPYAFSNAVHDYEGSSGKVVLDYGCGNGYVLGHYARNGATVHGVDLTEAAIRLARERFDLLGLEGSFVRTDGIELPFEDGMFDIACSMGVLHHVEDPTPIVAELFRVLKPGGKLVVMVYHRDSFRYHVTFRWRQRFGPAEFKGRPLQEVVNMNDGPDNPWAAVYSQAELRQLLAGFVDHRFLVSKLGIAELALWHSFTTRAFQRLVPGSAVRALARRVGWNLYCVAFKPAS